MSEWIEAQLVVLRRGGVVACPTETLVGLLADAWSHDAVERVVRLKRRPADEPIGLLVPDLAVAEQVATSVPPLARQLAERHWPGPLTLVLPARPELPSAIVQGTSVAVRVPGPSAALELVRAFGGPLTATSANRSGEPPASSAADVRRVFGDEVDGIVEGDAPGGAPSTVVDLSTDIPRVLREGAIDVRAEL